MYYSFALAGHKGTCLRPLHIFALLFAFSQEIFRKKYKKSTGGVHLTILLASPCVADFYETQHLRSIHLRNHVCQIFSRLVKGLRNFDSELSLEISLSVLHQGSRRHRTELPGAHSRERLRHRQAPNDENCHFPMSYCVALTTVWDCCATLWNIFLSFQQIPRKK